MKNGALSAAVAVSLAAFLALPTHARADSQTAALVRKVKPAVVQIITYDASGKAAKLGTGFFVNTSGDVITCRHVMEGADSANVRTSDGVDYPVAGIVAEDVDGDMVKLSISGANSSLPFLPLAPNPPSEGDPILVIGNPEGLGWTVSDGIVSAVRPIPGFGALVQITAPISQGSSGSPVINTKGQVVGLVDFYFATGQNLNFAMPASRMAGLKGEPARPLRDWSTAPEGSPMPPAEHEQWETFTGGTRDSGFAIEAINFGTHAESTSIVVDLIEESPTDGNMYVPAWQQPVYRVVYKPYPYRIEVYFTGVQFLDSTRVDKVGAVPFSLVTPPDNSVKQMTFFLPWPSHVDVVELKDPARLTIDVKPAEGAHIPTVYALSISNVPDVERAFNLVEQALFPPKFHPSVVVLGSAFFVEDVYTSQSDASEVGAELAKVGYQTRIVRRAGNELPHR